MEIVLTVALIVMTVIATLGWVCAFVFRRAYKQIGDNLKLLEAIGNMAMALGADAELEQAKEKQDPSIHLDDVLNDPRLN
jgi:hypothetical protein